MRCNFYNFLSKKKIWDPPYDIHIYSYQVQSEFKIQGMEKLLLPISTLSTFPTGNLKLKYFSTSEKIYRLFEGGKKKKKRIVYESWVPRKLAVRGRIGVSVGSANDVICAVTNTCGGRKVIFAASVHESGSMRVAAARLPTFQRVVHTRRAQGMPILRQVSWRSFTRGSAFLKHSLRISVRTGRDIKYNAIRSASQTRTVFHPAEAFITI